MAKPTTRTSKPSNHLEETTRTFDDGVAICCQCSESRFPVGGQCNCGHDECTQCYSGTFASRDLFLENPLSPSEVSTPGDSLGSVASTPGSIETAPDEKEPCGFDVLEVDEGEEVVSTTLDQQIKIKKSECRRRLAIIWRKRWEKINPKDALISENDLRLSANFPANLEGSEDCLLVWEHSIRPFLVEFVPKWCGSYQTIGLRRGRGSIFKFINIMTKEEIPEPQRCAIRENVLDLLPPMFHESIGFNFQTGIVEWLVGSETASNSDIDFTMPENPFYYKTPRMGDSVGITVGEGDDNSTSTLGPCLVIKNQAYWLLNLHPLEDAAKSRSNGAVGLTIEHPSPDDRIHWCEKAHHKSLHAWDQDFTLGKIVAASGKHRSITRKSSNPYWKDTFLEPPDVTVDWSLCTAEAPWTNVLRTPMKSGDQQTQPVVSIMQPKPDGFVRSSGRSSGYRRGRVGCCPDSVSKLITGAEEDTLEWFIEAPDEDEDTFADSGIGISGDSGAAIVDETTNAFIGHLWGRNTYSEKDTRQRITYFTPVQDVFDDIQDKFSLNYRPRLPVPGEARSVLDQGPACSECKELQQTPHQRSLTSPESMTSAEFTPSEDMLLTPADVKSPYFPKRNDMTLSAPVLCLRSADSIDAVYTHEKYPSRIDPGDLTDGGDCDLDMETRKRKVFNQSPTSRKSSRFD